MNPIIKMSPIILAAFLAFSSGCVSESVRHVSNYDRAYTEADVEGNQRAIQLLVREFVGLQHELADKNRYAPDDRARDLKRVGIILREAGDRLAAEEKRIRKRYNVWDVW